MTLTLIIQEIFYDKLDKTQASCFTLFLTYVKNKKYTLHIN